MSTAGAQEEERIIAASKRPDGTYRKERRVRAGYIPQDEQPVYQSKGALFRQNVPKCPGMDDAEAAKKPMSKSAKKNAKRKEKKESGTDDQVQEAADAVSSMRIADNAPSNDQPPGFQNKVVSAHPQKADQDDTHGPAQRNGNAAANGLHSAAVSEAPQDPAKQLRNLRKKIRQAESIASKAEEGKPLTAEEQEKLQKLLTWQEEAKRLEASPSISQQ